MEKPWKLYEAVINFDVNNTKNIPKDLESPEDIVGNVLEYKAKKIKTHDFAVIMLQRTPEVPLAKNVHATFYLSRERTPKNSLDSSWN